MAMDKCCACSGLALAALQQRGQQDKFTLTATMQKFFNAHTTQPVRWQQLIKGATLSTATAYLTKVAKSYFLTLFNV